MIAPTATAVALLILIWASGMALAVPLLRSESAAVRVGAAPIAGVCAALAFLELAGFAIATSTSAKLLALVALVAAAHAVWRWRQAKGVEQAGGALVEHLGLSALGLAIGLVPLFVAGRATPSSLTNDDATYYVSIGERLAAAAWRVHETGAGACLREHVLHVWHWRTGVPNLVAAVGEIRGLGPPGAVGLVTALLFSLVPSSAVLVARSLGAADSRRTRLIVGGLALVAAAPVFLAYQMLLGHLAAYVLFPVAVIALVRAMDKTGATATWGAALALGASVAVFADAALVLILAAVACLASHPRLVLHRGVRVATVAAATAACFPATLYRAARAGLESLGRARSGAEMFPQQGWSERTLLDDAATILGVDAWPPWSLTTQPPLGTSLAALGGLAALVALAAGARRLRAPRAAAVYVALLAVGVAVAELASPSPFVLGKVLLTAAAFAVPACATCVVLIPSRWAGVLAALYATGMLSASLQLARPDRFDVIDIEHHDRLVTELGKLPRGSYVALDGFGSPTDRVQDEHRAYRAALLAGHHVIQPGLDGGYYRPICASPPKPAELPKVAYALRRRSSETVSPGSPIVEWGPFDLTAVQLERPGSLIGVLAPVDGWLPAEQEPDGTVFRWGGPRTTLHLEVLQTAPCARLAGELRTIGEPGRVAIRLGSRRVYDGPVSGDWAPFRTEPILTDVAQRLVVEAATRRGSDPSRVIALRGAKLTPDPDCLRKVRRVLRTPPEPAFPETLTSTRDYSLVTPAGARCAEVAARFDAPGGGRIELSIGDAPMINSPASGDTTMKVPGVVLAPRMPITVRRRTDGEAPPWTVVGVSITPQACDE